MANLFPEILGIEAGQNSELANRIVDRIKAGNPLVDKKPYKVGDTSILEIPPDVPKKSKEKTIWQHAKKALILREKQERPEAGGLRFLHVFVSVGDVVEEYQFTLSIENECPYMCEFCYIQGSLAEKPIPTIFTNVQESGLLLREVKIALLAMHMHTQTHGFKHNIGWDQQKWVHRLIGVLNKTIPAEVADVPIQQIFENNKVAIKKALTDSKWELLKPILEKFDTLNFQKPTAQFKFNCGEINDALVYDHLTDNSKFLIELFSSDAMINDGAVLLFRTKSANFDNLKKLTPGDNIRVSVTILPAIYVKGPPEHKVRLQGANELLKLGYQISMNIDPIILTTDTVKTYKKIIDDIKTYFDYSSERFHRITIGMLRFGSKNLDNNIRKRHVDLYRHTKTSKMVKIPGDEKHRYDRELRVELYKTLVEYIQAEMPGVEVELSTEPVDVWKDVGLSWK
jgi:DNA repair photolyase